MLRQQNSIYTYLWINEWMPGLISICTPAYKCFNSVVEIIKLHPSQRDSEIFRPSHQLQVTAVFRTVLSVQDTWLNRIAARIALAPTADSPSTGLTQRR